MHKPPPSFAAQLIVMMLWTSSALATEVLRVDGPGGATARRERLGGLFTQPTGIAVEVIPNLGGSGGIKAAADGALDLAVSGRTLSAAGRGRGLPSTTTLRPSDVLATVRRAPPSMAERGVAEALALVRTNWPDGSRIVLVLRPRAESDNQVLIGLLRGRGVALDQARDRGDVPVAATARTTPTWQRGSQVRWSATPSPRGLWSVAVSA